METPYLKQSKRGQFSYRRAVPDPLRAAVGKREIKISLKTADTKTARVRWAQAHSEAEQILAAAKSGANLSEDILFNQSVQKLARHRLSLKKPSEWSNEERDNRSALQDILLDEAGFTSVDEFSEAFDGSLEHKRLAMDLGVASGTVITPPLTLSVIFKEWLRDKARKKDTDSQGWKKYKMQAERILDTAKEAIGDKEVTVITRADAKAYLHGMEEAGLSYETVKKYLSYVRSWASYAIREYELTIANPFEGLSAVRGEHEESGKESFTYDEVRKLLVHRSETNDELADIVLLMVYAGGARIGEIAGLAKSDLQLNGPIPFIRIRKNAIRRIKTDASVRDIPTTGEALERLRERLNRLSNAEDDAPVFPRYGKPGGNATASAALSKWLRERVKITDPKKSGHSIRHTMKDALREAKTQRDILDKIQGQTAGDVSSRYGSLELLEVKREAIMYALKIVGVE